VVEEQVDVEVLAADVEPTLNADGMGAILRSKGTPPWNFRCRGAMLAIEPFDDQPACAIIKHTTPCGLATGTNALDAYRKALACDPVSAFGSVIAFTVPVDDAAAEAISALFVECVVAPEFTAGAVEVLGRKKNLRLLEISSPADPSAPQLPHNVTVSIGIAQAGSDAPLVAAELIRNADRALYASKANGRDQVTVA